MTVKQSTRDVNFKWSYLRVYCAEYVPCQFGDVAYSTCVYPYDSMERDEISEADGGEALAGGETEDEDSAGNCWFLRVLRVFRCLLPWAIVAVLFTTCACY